MADGARDSKVLGWPIMQAWLTFAAIFLVLLVGLGAGNAAGARLERQSIANDCKYGGSFVLRHTGYQCHAL